MTVDGRDVRGAKRARGRRRRTCRGRRPATRRCWRGPRAVDDRGRRVVTRGFDAEDLHAAALRLCRAHAPLSRRRRPRSRRARTRAAGSGGSCGAARSKKTLAWSRRPRARWSLAEEVVAVYGAASTATARSSRSRRRSRRPWRGDHALGEPAPVRARRGVDRSPPAVSARYAVRPSSKTAARRGGRGRALLPRPRVLAPSAPVVWGNGAARGGTWRRRGAARVEPVARGGRELRRRNAAQATCATSTTKRPWRRSPRAGALPSHRLTRLGAHRRRPPAWTAAHPLPDASRDDIGATGVARRPSASIDVASTTPAGTSKSRAGRPPWRAS